MSCARCLKPLGLNYYYLREMGTCYLIFKVIIACITRFIQAIFIYVKSVIELALTSVFNFLEVTVLTLQVIMVMDYITILLSPDLTYDEQTGLYVDLITDIHRTDYLQSRFIKMASISTWI